MEKVREKAKKYEVSTTLKGNGYYIARISFKIGGGPSPRLEKSGTTEELALLALLDKLIEYIDNSFKSDIITCKIDDIVSKRLVKSINDIAITTPTIMEKTLLIVNKINYINSCILNNISLQSNIVPFYSQNSISNTSTSNFTVIPSQDNIVSSSKPIIHNVDTNKKVAEPVEQIIIEDLAIEWLKYRQALCKETKDNPNPISRKTLDGNRNRLKNDILPFLKSKKKLYLSQLTKECIEDLLKNINSQNAKHKSYIVLNQLFKYAIKEKNFDYNPMLKVDKPPESLSIKAKKKNNIETPKKKEDYIKSADQDLWLDLFEKEHEERKLQDKKSDMPLLFAIMLMTGLRPEEACGLKWEALDLDKNILFIDNAFKQANVYDDNMDKIGNDRFDDTLKTDESYREIPLTLNERIKKLLLRHKEYQQELFKKARAIKDKHLKWNKEQYIFLSRTYKPYVPESLSQGLRNFRAKYNLKRVVTPYGLRRSFATYWAEKGMDDIFLQALMRTR